MTEQPVLIFHLNPNLFYLLQLKINLFYLKKINLFHGLCDAVEISCQRFVHFCVIELSVPLPFLRIRHDRKFGVAALHQRKVLEVLGHGGGVESSAVVLELKLLKFL